MNAQEILAEVFEQLRGFWRFRWWAVGVAWLISLVGWVYVASVPNTYQASARVYVDTNSLLKPLMQGLTAQQNTLNEVQLVSTAVLTRPNLEAVARTTDLALRAKTPEELESLITDLQHRVTVSGGRDNIFRIDYKDVSREKARDVVAAVLDTFIEDAIGAQDTDAEVTERALQGEIQEHQERLESAEAGLAAFKRDNVGFMPGESGDYYNRLQNALAEVAGTERRIQQLSHRSEELKRQISGEEPVFGIMPGGGVEQCSEKGHLEDLRRQLSALLVDFTEKHPRVVALKDTIETLEKRCATEPATGLGGRGKSGESLETNPVYQNLRIQLSNTEVELAEARGQLTAHQGAVAELRRNVDKIAEVETQLKQLNRDYDVVQGRHKELLKRWEDLQAKKRLDPVTDNVQFRRIDPPFALADPVGPNRPLLLAGVLLAALVGGGGVVFGLNQLRPVYFSRRSIQRLSGLPVLGTVSVLLTPAEVVRRRWAGALWVGCYLMLFIATGAVVVVSNRAAEFFSAFVSGLGA